MRKYLALCAMVLAASCSATTTTRPVPFKDDSTATGFRYLKTHNFVIQVYEISAEAEKDSIMRVGDVVISSLPDPNALFEVTFQGALFTTQALNITMSDKGTLKSVGLEKTDSETAGAVSAARSITENIRDFEKTRMQAEIDNLNRELSLIRARRELQDALKQNK